ncbi:MAG: hypothetical protein WD076_05100 [Parvularculaceae bacterium]
MPALSRVSAAAFVALIVMAAPARADGLNIDSGAYAKYVDGDYDAAVAAASSIGGAGNFALAARALNAAAYFEDKRKQSRLLANRALDFAEESIRMKPDFLEAHLEAAIGLSLRGANMAPARALILNLPARARRHMDVALALDSASFWALSTSAAWRLEVARRGGGAVFGADPVQGYEEFMKAREIAPGNVVVAYECALRLIASKRAEWRAVALQSLDAALAGVPESAFETRLQGHAREFAAAIKAGPDAEAKFIDAQP